MPLIIPFEPGDPEQRVEIAIDGETYVLRARWNTYDSAWYLDAWERDGKTPIAIGIKLVVGVMLGQTIDHPLLLPGMFCFDTARGGDPGFDDLGTRVFLISTTAADRVVLEQP